MHSPRGAASRMLFGPIQACAKSPMQKRRGCSGLREPAALWRLDGADLTLLARVCPGQVQMCHLDTAQGIWRRSCPAETMSGAW